MMAQVKHLIDTICKFFYRESHYGVQWKIVGPHGIIAYDKHLMLNGLEIKCNSLYGFNNRSIG